MRRASAATMPPTCAASARSAVSIRSSQGLAIAVNSAASTPPPRASRVGGGALPGVGSETVAPAHLEDHGPQARVQVEPLQLEQAVRPPLRRLRVDVEAEGQLRLVLQQEAHLEPDRVRDELGETRVG